MSERKFRRLFTPVTLRGKTLRNRIVFGAHTANMAADGLPTRQHVGYYVERAIGEFVLPDLRRGNLAARAAAKERFCRGFSLFSLLFTVDHGRQFIGQDLLGAVDPAAVPAFHLTDLLKR